MDGPRLVQRTCAAWSRPLGSYTYAIPGGVGARSTLASADLAREPLANRVLLAAAHALAAL